jgi:hypothetical protein
MTGTKSFLAQELTKFFEAAWLEVPAEAGKILLGIGDEHELRRAGWKAYDAWVSLANEMTNAVYSNPIIGEATGRVMESVLRLQQIGGTMAAAFFGNLWPSLELPTHSEIVALRDDLLALREELAANAIRTPASQDSDETYAQDPQRAGWRGARLNGALFNGYRVTGGNAARGSANQGKRHVAAR